MSTSNNVNANAFKSGIWAIICTFIQSSISFLTMPIFTRLLSPDEYGVVTTFNSWQTILGTVCTLCLYASISKAVFDYSDHLDEYVSSMMSFTIILLGISFFIVFNWVDLGMEKTLVVVLFLSILANASFNIYSGVKKFQLRYKVPAILTIITVICNLMFAMIFIYSAHENRAEAKIFGESICAIIIGIGLLIISLKKGKTLINVSYWRYGLKFGIPMMINAIGMQILNQSDRIMINKISGSYAAGVYSVPYSICNIIILLWSSVTTGLSPWMYTKLNEKKIDEINYVIEKIVKIVFVIVITFITFSPLAIRILADVQYLEGVYCMPPIAIGMYFMCIYNFFMTLENYHRKPYMVAVCTTMVAGINIWLNYKFIPLFGYRAAAYTTMICYIVLSIAHCFVSRIMDHRKVFPILEIFGYGILVFVIGNVLGALYELPIYRCSFYLLIILVMYIKNKNDVQILWRILLEKMKGKQ